MKIKLVSKENGVWISLFALLFIGGIYATEEYMFYLAETTDPIQISLPVTQVIDSATDSATGSVIDVTSEEGTVDSLQTENTILLPQAIIHRLNTLKVAEIPSWMREQGVEIEHLPTWLALIKHQFRLKKYLNSYTLSSYLLTLFPEQAELLFQHARILNKQSKITQAISVYQKIIRIYPSHQSSYINLGLLFAQKDQHLEAIAIWQKAVEVSHGDKKAKALASIASSQRVLGNYELAIKFYRQSILYRPSHASTWRKIAYVQILNETSPTEVVNSYQKAMVLDKGYFLAQSELARYRWINEIDKGQPTIRDILKTAPNYRAGHEWLAFRYFRQNKPRSFQKELAWLLKNAQSKKKEKLWSAIAVLTAKLSDKNIRRLEMIKTKSFWKYVYLAEAQFKNKNGGAASDNWSQLQSHVWLKKYAQYRMVQLSIDGETLAVAQKNVDSYSEQYPLLTSIFVLQAELFMKHKKYSAAAESYQQIVTLGTSDFATRQAYASSLRLAGQFTLAESIYRELVDERPTYKRIKLDLARTLKAKGDDVAAEEILQDLIHRFPDYLRGQTLLLSWQVENKKWLQVIQTASNLLQLKPELINTRINLLEAYQALKMTTEVLVEAKRLSRLEINSSKIYIKLFDIFRQLGELEQAHKIWLKLPLKEQVKRKSMYRQ